MMIRHAWLPAAMDTSTPQTIPKTTASWKNDK